ncbi:MAG: hypothetical protein P4L81_06655 [Candidatus Pacebacteria bacterium]|nr:hypothetical protein [Candidatus Paceibacterota bacterium]
MKTFAQAVQNRLPRFVRVAIDRISRDVRTQPSKLLIASVSAVAALLVFNIEVALIWWLFLLFLMYKWNTRIIETLAGLALLDVVVLFGIGRLTWAVNSLVFAYFLIVMAGTLRFVPYLRDSHFGKPKQFS